jgi:ferrous iron transport protein A
MSQAEVLVPQNDFAAVEAAEGAVPLSAFRRGDRGVITRIGDETLAHSALGDGELERRLLELGFVEGASVELLHEGAIGRDPIAVSLDGSMRVALRRREAAIVFVARTGRRA